MTKELEMGGTDDVRERLYDFHSVRRKEAWKGCIASLNFGLRAINLETKRFGFVVHYLECQHYY